MPTVRGRAEVRQFIAAAPAQLTNVVRGAARAGAKVIADEIKVRTTSDHVREDVRIRSKQEDGQIVVKIDVKPGWGRSVGIWLEYGTEPHFIRVDESQRQGMSVGKINEAHKAGSLVINGNFVGTTVFHPGSRPVPAFRPAIDIMGPEAIATAQAYINSRVSRSGISPAQSEGIED